MSDKRDEVDGLEFGPSGYLPERASKRARKIVLRSPLGLQWVVASLVAGLVVVVAGVLFLQRSGAPPAEPWVPAARLAELGSAHVVEDLDVLLVPGAGRIRAFATADDISYCEASNRLESPDGEVWSLTGRGLGGAPSLDEHPTRIQDDTVYVDPTVRAPGPDASDERAEPGCAGT
ncbi:MAG: hypothetical protein WD638_07065 [Nitriliruptoraceae bacterium]